MGDVGSEMQWVMWRVHAVGDVGSEMQWVMWGVKCSG